MASTLLSEVSVEYTTIDQTLNGVFCVLFPSERWSISGSLVRPNFVHTQTKSL